MSCALSPSGPMIAVDLRRVERQHGAVVLQQHRPSAPAALRAAARFCGSSCLPGAAADVDVRVLEQPGAELHRAGCGARRRRCGFIDTCAARHQLLAEVAVVGRDHLGVGAGVERHARRPRGRPRRRRGRTGPPAGLHARAGAQLGDRRVVALDEAVEAPALLEDVGLGVLVRAARHAVDRVERAHQRVRAGVDRRLERRQVEVPQPLERHVGRVVVAPALRLAVGGEVLDARHDLVGRAVVAALGALHARRGHHGVQVRVLARGLGDAAPARLVREVDHRAVDLLEPDGRGLERADAVVGAGHARDRSCWPRRAGSGRSSGSRGSCRRRTGSGCRSREFSTASCWYLLISAGSVSLKTAPTGLRASAGFVLHLPVGEQRELVELLLERHAAQQRVDAALDRAVEPLLRRRCSARLVARARRPRQRPPAAIAPTATTATTIAYRETLRHMVSPSDRAADSAARPHYPDSPRQTRVGARRSRVALRDVKVAAQSLVAAAGAVAPAARAPRRSRRRCATTRAAPGRRSRR